jgi:hypothetical protein
MNIKKLAQVKVPLKLGSSFKHRTQLYIDIIHNTWE